MSEYIKHEISGLDMTILDRITEAEITEWMCARMHAAREAGTPIGSMDCEVWHRDYRRPEAYYDTKFGGHAVGKCASGQTSAEMIAELKEKVANNPRERAREKRDEARRAMAEAEKLEALADSLG